MHFHLALPCRIRGCRRRMADPKLSYRRPLWDVRL
jgi:hypothetical protein